ncbi:MAG: CbtB-domain containing protein [Ilumatobacteraceae bacterium]
MNTALTPPTAATPVVLPITKAVLWLVTASVLALLVYYFVGIDQGATSIFGHDTHIHEFVHDARHFLGFPCH